MARGHFATSLYTSLSRAQIEFGGPSTFGLEVSRCPYAYNPKSRSSKEIEEEKKAGNESTNKNVSSAKGVALKGKKEENVLGAKDGSSFRLGNMIDRGCFNYRWPVTEYYLDLHPDHAAIEMVRKDAIAKARKKALEKANKDAHDASQGKDDTKENEGNGKKKTEKSSKGKHVGICQMFSCAKNNMFYQVLRIEELRSPEGDDFDMSFPRDSQIVLTIGGPVWFQSFNDGDHGLEEGKGKKTARNSFRWSSKAKTSIPLEEKEEVIDTSGDEPTKIIRYWDKDKDKEKWNRGLEARVYQIVDGKPKELDMNKSVLEADNGPEDVPGSTKITAYNAVVELKDDPRLLNRPKSPRSATFLAVIRLIDFDKEENSNWPEHYEPPTSQALYNHVGVDPFSLHATGAMWEGIFLDQRKGSEPVLDLTEFNIIGRSLEKILQVDIVPATFFNNDEGDGEEYAALVSNLFVRANIDLKSLL